MHSTIYLFRLLAGCQTTVIWPSVARGAAHMEIQAPSMWSSLLIPDEAESKCFMECSNAMLCHLQHV